MTFLHQCEHLLCRFPLVIFRKYSDLCHFTRAVTLFLCQKPLRHAKPHYQHCCFCRVCVLCPHSLNNNTFNNPLIWEHLLAWARNSARCTSHLTHRSATLVQSQAESRGDVVLQPVDVGTHLWEHGQFFSKVDDARDGRSDDLGELAEGFQVHLVPVRRGRHRGLADLLWLQRSVGG